jgi:hypothetical protein
MKKAVLFLAVSVLMLMISCGDEQPTKVSNYEFDKRNIENDTNWVEITDIDTVEVCISAKLYTNDTNGLIVNSEVEYRNLFLETLKDEDYLWAVRNHPELTNCTEEYQIPAIDFDKRDLILYRTALGGGQPIWKRKIYINKRFKVILYLLETTLTTYTLENSHYSERITIPKFKSQYTIKFDTLLYFPD